MAHSAALRPQDFLRFVEIEPFPRMWSGLKLEDEDLRALQTLVMAMPRDAAVMRGSGGLRKIRFSKNHSDQGKSGSFRVYYVYFPEYGIVLLMAIVAKSNRPGLNKADLNALAPVISRFKKLLDQGVIR